MASKLFKSFGYKGIQIVVLILYSLLLIPILLNYWDLEVYGAWIALYAFFNIIQVVELGHSVFVGNEFNRIVHVEKVRAQTILGSALRANIVVGFLQLLLVFIIYIFGLFRFLLDKNIDDREVAMVLMILFLYRMSIGSFRGIIVKMLNPFGLIYKGFQFSLFEKILEFFILIGAAMLGASLIELALYWFVLKFLYSAVILFQLKKILPEYFPWWKYGNFRLGIRNFIKSVPFGASNFMDRLGNDGIVLVVSALVGTTFLPLFSATRTLVNFGLKLSDFFLSPLVPEIINFHAKGKQSKILDILRSYWFVTSVVLMTGFTASLFFIKDLFHFWTNDKLEFNLALYSTLVIVFLVQNYGKALVVFFTAINKTKVVLATSIFRLSLFFIIALTFRSHGLYSVLIGLFISELCVATLWLPYNSFKIFPLNFRQKAGFLMNLFTVLCLGILFYLNFMGQPTWLLIILFVPIAFFMYYQFTFISKDTSSSVFRSLKKLTTFASKRK